MTLSNYFALNVDPSQALPETYNYGLVLLSYLVAVLGSYAFLQFATRIAELREAGLRYSWLVIGAIAMGGGIWAMHFIGMLAHILPIPVSYDPWTTALSIVPASLGAGVALHVVARPAITTSRLLIGGTLMGAGIGAMHYTGMMAMQLNALVRYDPTLFAASIVVAVLLAVLALQVRQVISKLNLIRFGIVRDGVGALIMGFAVTAMHYTAMASTYCFATPGPHRTPVDHSVFAGVTALIASLVLLLTIVAVMFDRRVAQETSSHRRTSEQLLQAQKMEAVGQLTGGVAHDFNNILMVIMANLDVLEEQTDLEQATRTRIRRIGNATQRAHDLTRQLLAFSRRQALQPVAIDINELVHDTVGLLRRTLGEMVEVETVLSGGLWDVYIDRAQLEAALVNLAINARDAMPEGGRLRVAASNLSLSAGAASGGIAPGDYVVIAVSDTGKGMSPGVLEKAFEPFFTTKEAGKGTGLGLSMVYGFLQQSKGHVRIESEVGRGTTVRLYLPRSSEPTPESTAASQAADMERGTERILVVEDDARVRAGVLEQLASLGYHATGAGDGAAGLAAFEAAQQPFDLLLTDVIVPGPMNGKALAEEVRRRWPGTRLLFMSGYSQNILSTQGRLEPGVLLLNKPFRKHELAKMLRRAFDGPFAALDFSGR